MMWISIAPELGVALAAKQCMEASQELEKLETGFSSQDFTIAHAFYVKMGGIVVVKCPQETSSAQRGMEPINEGALGHSEDRESAASILRGSNAKFVQSLSELVDEAAFFKIPENEIKDLSKADVITKAFAITQCTWLVIQSIARRTQGYAISQLELATLAFIFCAVIMHIFWWNKPFDVETRRVIVLKGTSSASMNPPAMDDLVKHDRELLRARVKDLSTETFDGLISEMADLTSLSTSFKKKIPSATLYITTTVFLAIHLLAWNWEFPSVLIRSLWRWFNIGALVASLLPVALIAAFDNSGVLDHSTFLEGTCLFIYSLSLLAYIIARLVVLGLTFYSLTSMPERAYHTVDWLAWVPHFS
ncbi:hypothetical protein F53441_5492 [Fusarium austroafricanum]|uniref:Uncharacterized protein n=1 Tax=Fusarium austroafricanum TaxID=2364996 RepID=A0A8H4KK10_9HYPO|nr:hypothetical protein F53441_5492 [Fusarium austroafricanum]